MRASRACWQNAQVPLSWATVAGATDYRVQYRIGAGSWTQTAWQTAANVTVGTLVNGTTYEFQVQAHNIGGNGAWSASANASGGCPRRGRSSAWSGWAPGCGARAGEQL
jgi:hypothetical protein